MKKEPGNKRERKGKDDRIQELENAKVFARKQANGNKKGDEGREARPILSIPSLKVHKASWGRDISYTKNLTAVLFHVLVVSCQNDRICFCNLDMVSICSFLFTLQSRIRNKTTANNGTVEALNIASAEQTHRGHGPQKRRCDMTSAAPPPLIQY